MSQYLKILRKNVIVVFPETFFCCLLLRHLFNFHHLINNSQKMSQRQNLKLLRKNGILVFPETFFFCLLSYHLLNFHDLNNNWKKNSIYFHKCVMYTIYRQLNIIPYRISMIYEKQGEKMSLLCFVRFFYFVSSHIIY